MRPETETENVGPELRYQTFLDNDEFRIQQCGSCDTSIFFPRAICPHCGDAENLQWYEPSGKGTVYSTTVVRRKPEHGGDYNVVLIDLAEGPRMMSRVVDLQPGDVTIGMDVQAKITEKDGAKLVVFAPVEVQK